MDICTYSLCINPFIIIIFMKISQWCHLFIQLVLQIYLGYLTWLSDMLKGQYGLSQSKHVLKNILVFRINK